MTKASTLLRISFLLCFPIAIALTGTTSCNSCTTRIPADKETSADSASYGVFPTERLRYNVDTAFVDGALTWSAEIDYPTGTTSALRQAVAEWIDNRMGGTYSQSDGHPQDRLKHYADRFIQRYGESGQSNDEYPSDIEANYEIQLYKEFDGRHWVTYSMHSYRLLNNEGLEEKTMVTFTKPEGKLLDWSLVAPEHRTRLARMAAERLNRLSMLSSVYDKPLAEYLLPSLSIDSLPLPVSAPALANGMILIYQPGEIAGERYGSLSCSIPYDSLLQMLAPAEARWLEEGRKAFP